VRGGIGDGGELVEKTSGAKRSQRRVPENFTYEEKQEEEMDNVKGTKRLLPHKETVKEPKKCALKKEEG